MKLILNDQRDEMYKNWLLPDSQKTLIKPVVKFFTPDAQCTWLFSELDPSNDDILFGLCDLGLGSPELGYASLTELKTVRGQIGLPIERDRGFTPNKSLNEYAEEAASLGRIKA